MAPRYYNDKKLNRRYVTRSRVAVVNDLANSFVQAGEKAMTSHVHKVKYEGRRCPSGNVVLRYGRVFTHDDSRKIRNHSPTGFEWGYGGSGPAQLALALMLDTVGPARLRYAELLYQSYKFAHVCIWKENWTVYEGAIERFIEQHYPDWRARVCPIGDEDDLPFDQAPKAEEGVNP